MVVRWTASALIVAAISIGSWTPAFSQTEQAGSISGIIAAENGSPIPGADVLLKSTSLSSSTKSNASGFFVFQYVPVGSYILIAKAPNYKSATSAPFNVTAKQSVSLSVILQPNTNASLTTIGTVTVKGRATVNTTPASTVSITSADLVKQGAVTVSEGLEKVPGVTLQVSGGPNDPVYITIRGATGASENLILQDGEPIGTILGYPDLETITPAIYSRVEVLEGLGATSLFGAASIGGTVNLVTRDPTKSPSGQLLYGVGSPDLSDYNAWYSDSFNRLGILFDVHGYNTTGPVPGNYRADLLPTFVSLGLTPNPTSFNSSAIGVLLNPTYLLALKSGLGKIRYDLSNSTYITFSTSLEHDARYGYEIGPAFLQPLQIGSKLYSTDPNGNPYLNFYPGGYGWNQQNKYMVDIHTQLGGGDLYARSYVQYLDNIASFVPPQPLFSMQTSVFGFCCSLFRIWDRGYGDLISYTKQLGANTVTMSIGGRAKSINSLFAIGIAATPTFNQLMSVYGAGTDVERTVMLRDDASLNAKLRASVSGFYSAYDALGVKRFDPRLAFIYQPDSGSVFRLTAGSGFAPPTLIDRIQPIVTTFGGYNTPLCPSSEPNCTTNGGNPNLVAESAKGVDFGYERLIGPNGKIGITLYRTNLRDQILFGLAPAPPGLHFPDGTPVLYLFEPLNVGTSVYTGAQLDASIPIYQHVTFEPAYGVQSAYPTGATHVLQLTNPNFVNNQQLPGVPLHQGTATLRYANASRFDAHASLTYFDNNNPYHVPPFSIIDLGITVPLGSESLLHVTDHNVGNKNGFYFQGAPGSGVPYPGLNGPFLQQALPYGTHRVTVTFEERFGAF